MTFFTTATEQEAASISAKTEAKSRGRGRPRGRPRGSSKAARTFAACEAAARASTIGRSLSSLPAIATSAEADAGAAAAVHASNREELRVLCPPGGAAVAFGAYPHCKPQVHTGAATLPLFAVGYSDSGPQDQNADLSVGDAAAKTVPPGENLGIKSGALADGVDEALGGPAPASEARPAMASGESREPVCNMTADGEMTGVTTRGADNGTRAAECDALVAATSVSTSVSAADTTPRHVVAHATEISKTTVGAASDGPECVERGVSVEDGATTSVGDGALSQRGETGHDDQKGGRDVNDKKACSVGPEIGNGSIDCAAGEENDITGQELHEAQAAAVTSRIAAEWSALPIATDAGVGDAGAAALENASQQIAASDISMRPDLTSGDDRAVSGEGLSASLVGDDLPGLAGMDESSCQFASMSLAASIALDVDDHSMVEAAQEFIR